MSKRLVRWDRRLQRQKHIYLTLADLLRIKPWQQDRRNQTKSNPEYVRLEKKNKQGKQTEETDDKKVARKETSSAGRDTEETKHK